jgi:hypothetical protein
VLATEVYNEVRGQANVEQAGDRHGAAVTGNDPAYPLNALYGTFLVLALCNVFHYHAQAS